MVYWPNPAEPEYAICVADCPADALESVSFPVEDRETQNLIHGLYVQFLIVGRLGSRI